MTLYITEKYLNDTFKSVLNKKDNIVKNVQGHIMTLDNTIENFNNKNIIQTPKIKKELYNKDYGLSIL